MSNVDINVEAFSFVDRLQPFDEKEEGPIPTSENIDENGALPVIHLGDVKNLSLERFNPIDGKAVSMYKHVGGKAIGLNQSAFSDFSELLIKVLQLKEFDGKCDFDFLIDNSFDWLIEIYTAKIAGQNLTGYLLDKLEDETKEYAFFYKIDGFFIQTDFTIGNSLITNITDEEIEKLNSENKSEAINQIHSEELKGVNVKVVVKSTYENAKKIALKQAEVSVDVLKCFLAKFSLHRYHAIPDLMHRGVNLKKHVYHVFTNDYKSNGVQVQNLSGFIPLRIDNKFIENANKRGLVHFSDFLKLKCYDELYLEIIDMIQRFSEIVSTLSPHAKIVKIISLLEGAILSRPSRGRSMGEKKIKNYVLPKLTTTQLELFQRVIRKCYEIRDAYLHNCQELPVEEETIWTVFEIARIFLIRLIMLHKSGRKEFEDIAVHFTN